MKKKIDPIEEQLEMWETFDDLYVKVEKHRCLKEEVDDFIIDKIKEVLIEENWNKTKASEKLGIKRTTLLSKIKRYRLW